MARVKLVGVSKKFDDVVAVDNVSFDVEDGELLCLLGPSGCGKTTTLRMISGLETQTTGQIYIGDSLVDELSPEKRNIAMVFQFYAIYPGMKVYDQIGFPLKIKNRPREVMDKKIRQVAEMLELTSHLESDVSGLTMEQKQKVELGRAIATEPSCFLFDEPLTNLDTKVRTRMRVRLRQLQKQLKTTCIYVTHDQLEAMAIADKIAVMNEGKILQFDAPETLYEYPRDLFVAGFIGSPPMNFIDCTLVEKGDKIFLDAGDFTYDITYLHAARAGKIAYHDLVLGIRPEHVTLTESKINENSIGGIVDVVELLGERIVVNVKIGHHLLKSNMRSVPIKSGDKVHINFNPAEIRIFDKKLGSLIVWS